MTFCNFRSLGLRMVMGEYPVENVLEHVLGEMTRGWNHMDCEKLFPRSVHSLIPYS